MRCGCGTSTPAVARCPHAGPQERECYFVVQSRRNPPTVGIAGRDDPIVGCRHTSAALRPHRKSVECGGEPDGHRIASAGDDGTVRLERRQWPFDGQAARGRRPGAYSAVFSPDGRRLATAGADGTVRMWDATPARSLAPPSIPGRGHAPAWRSVPKDAAWLSAVVTKSGCGMSKWAVPSVEPLIHGELVHSVAFSPDGNRIVSGGMETGYNGTVRLWDANTGQLIGSPNRRRGCSCVRSVLPPTGAPRGRGWRRRHSAVGWGSLDKVGQPTASP